MKFQALNRPKSTKNPTQVEDGGRDSGNNSRPAEV